jgi:hypothetical protein
MLNSFKKETTYLSHVVPKDGGKPNPSKTEAVKNLPIPKSVKQVRQFLGLGGYNRRFIHGFAALARPLSDTLIGDSTKKKARYIKKNVKRSVWE